MPFTPLSRRKFLHGAGGIALGLPWLEAMADEPRQSVMPATPPRRIGYVYVPNGIYMAMFQPAEAGPNYTMPETLKIMEPFRNQLNFYTGLDGPLSGHSTAGYLTAVDPSKVPGFSFKNSISVDQVVANSAIGQATRYPCLNAAIGVSESQLSWSAEGVPQPAEADPQRLFERLFVPDDKQATTQRIAELGRRKRLLDSVLEESRAIQRQLGTVDQKKIDEYLTSIREVEKDLERQKAWINAPKPHVVSPALTAKNTEEKQRLHLSILALAFQTDSTRTFTYLMGGEAGQGGGGYAGMINHHSGSHCGNEEFFKDHPAIHRAFIDINQLEIKIFADFIGKLAGMKEGNGTVLDNSCIVYGSAHRMLNHWKDSLPLISVGSLGGKLKTGSHVCLSHFGIGWEWNSKERAAKYRGRTIGDFHLTLLRQLGLDVKALGWGANVISEICV